MSGLFRRFMSDEERQTRPARALFCCGRVLISENTSDLIGKSRTYLKNPHAKPPRAQSKDFELEILFFASLPARLSEHLRAGGREILFFAKCF
jgi:hypothetical protein